MMCSPGRELRIEGEFSVEMYTVYIDRNEHKYSNTSDNGKEIRRKGTRNVRKCVIILYVIQTDASDYIFLNIKTDYFLLDYFMLFGILMCCFSHKQYRTIENGTVQSFLKAATYLV